mgnify:CR=1 FL=1
MMKKTWYCDSVGEIAKARQWRAQRSDKPILNEVLVCSSCRIGICPVCPAILQKGIGGKIKCPKCLLSQLNEKRLKEGLPSLKEEEIGAQLKSLVERWGIQNLFLYSPNQSAH